MAHIRVRRQLDDRSHDRECEQGILVHGIIGQRISAR
jgi:hypothetical protein